MEVQNVTSWLLLVQLIYCLLNIRKIIEFIRVARKVIRRDLVGGIKLVKVQYYLLKYRLFDMSVPDVFAQTVARHPDKACIKFLEEVWSFKDLDRFTNRVANAFTQLGYKTGDEVSLLMENRPEYIGVWLGLAKIGVVPAFINTNQRKSALVHAINCINSSALIFTPLFNDAINEVLTDLKSLRKLQFLSYGIESKNQLNTECLDLKTMINEASNSKPKHKGKFTDKLFYIYTSGTTGMPKASIIKHFRYFFGSVGCFCTMSIVPDDVLYAPLPLYHSVAGILASGLAIIRGTTVIFRPKFSASQFWTDCIRYDCTIAQYIGELCRYLLAQPEGPTDKAHHLRMIFGNGLRKTFWKPMKERFGIKKIIEFFGSTEGNASLINYADKEGSCGFLPFIYPNILIKNLYPLNLIKYDREQDKVIRDENGFCIPCSAGESGMLISLIGKKDPIKTFDGYTNKKETEKKIVTNVFREGDSAFLSGDLMKLDEEHYLFFKDRVGDTFRWKGENVSTTEVENIISSIIKFQECVVIGVELPGHEGKAGMLILTSQSKDINLNELLNEMKKKLPSYSIPLFVRIAEHLDYTSTFKLQKVQLKKEGYNVDLVDDNIYMLNWKEGRYELLTRKSYEDILQCNVRL